MSKFSSLYFAIFFIFLSMNTAYAELEISPQMQWVASTERIGYFFYPESVCYALNNSGEIDKNKIVVTLEKIYDWTEIQNIIEIRQRMGKSIDGYEHLRGRFEGLIIDPIKKTVTFYQYVDVCEDFPPLSAEQTNHKFNFKDLSAEYLDLVSQTLIYAENYKSEIIEHTNKKILKCKPFGHYWN